MQESLAWPGPPLPTLSCRVCIQTILFSGHAVSLDPSLLDISAMSLTSSFILPHPNRIAANTRNSYSLGTPNSCDNHHLTHHKGAANPFSSWMQAGMIVFSLCHSPEHRVSHTQVWRNIDGIFIGWISDVGELFSDRIPHLNLPTRTQTEFPCLNLRRNTFCYGHTSWHQAAWVCILALLSLCI